MLCKLPRFTCSCYHLIAWQKALWRTSECDSNVVCRGGRAWSLRGSFTNYTIQSKSWFCIFGTKWSTFSALLLLLSQQSITSTLRSIWKGKASWGGSDICFSCLLDCWAWIPSEHAQLGGVKYRILVRADWTYGFFLAGGHAHSCSCMHVSETSAHLHPEDVSDWCRTCSFRKGWTKNDTQRGFPAPQQGPLWPYCGLSRRTCCEKYCLFFWIQIFH